MGRGTARSGEVTIELLAEIVQRVVAVTVGDADRAATLVERGLQAAGRSRLPEREEDLVAFAWAHLVGLVMSDVDATSASEMMVRLHTSLNDLHARPITGVPQASVDAIDIARVVAPVRRSDSVEVFATSEVRGIASGHSALLVGFEKTAGVEIARALVRSGMTVVAADEMPAGLDALDHVDGRAPLSVVCCDLGARDIALHLFELLRRHPAVDVVGTSAAIPVGDALLRLVGVRRFEVVAATVPSPRIVASALRLAAARTQETG